MIVVRDMSLAVMRHAAEPMVVPVASAPWDGLGRWLRRVSLHSFNRDHLPSGGHGQQHQATVDGAITRLSSRVTFDDDNRASTAVAFRAAFLGASAATRTQKIEQRRVRRYSLHLGSFAVESKLERALA